jgi:hypothetical protein
MTLETDMRSRIAELRHKHDDAALRITAALIGGTDTGPIRAELADLDHGIRLIEQRIFNEASERLAAAQEAISASAAIIAADAESFITNTLARLEPPTHP